MEYFGFLKGNINPATITKTPRDYSPKLGNIIEDFACAVITNKTSENLKKPNVLL